MNTPYSMPTRFTLMFLLTLGLFPGLGGRQSVYATEQIIPPKDQVTEKAFLASKGVVKCKLKETTISKLDIPKNKLPSFVRRMEQKGNNDLKQGLIKLAGRDIKILLGETLGRDFFVYDVGKGKAPYWWGSWSLHAYHLLDNTFYEFMLVNNDSEIAARPYTGDLGVFKLGHGERTVSKMEFSGSVHQPKSVAAPVGTITEGWVGPVSDCRIPVGDYTPYIMSVTYDNLRISISNNYHTNAQGESSSKNTVYGLKIRKEKPCVLDFSNKPMVIFDRPSMKQSTFSRGEEIEFAAVLIDPKLDIMIRGLDDTSVEVEEKTSNGTTYKRPKSLDPSIVITRADGEVVAEGVLPFG
jgi:hypothetical protein